MVNETDEVLPTRPGSVWVRQPSNKNRVLGSQIPTGGSRETPLRKCHQQEVSRYKVQEKHF